MGKNSITRKYRVQNLGLPAVALAPQPEDIAIAFQPAFEKMWLAAGLEQGSPCG